MDTVFDIAEDELQVFLAEADEHLQMLDEGLVQLERRGDDAELLQAIFRAAHTLKGSAGVIGHRRMADLTHAMETALDGLRKGTLAVSTPLVDACLEALDALKLLRNEVADGEISPADISPLADRLAALGKPTPLSPPVDGGMGGYAIAVIETPTATATTTPHSNGKKNGRTGGKRAAGTSPKRGASKSNGPLRERAAAAPRTGGSQTRPDPAAPGLLIRADIAENSMASAARAFQIMLALQSLGEVQELQPPQAVIETAAPVRRVTARLTTNKTAAEVREALAGISDIERLAIGGEAAVLAPASTGVQLNAPTSEAESPDSESQPRLGTHLLNTGYINAAQLQAALERQTADPVHAPLLGQTLVSMGAISPAALDRAVAEHKQQMRTVRTSVERLDNLMNLVGELITDRNRMSQIRGELEARLRGDGQVENLTQTAIHIGRITDQLQEEVMRIRMLPVASVFNKFPRLVRDLARSAGKQVDLVVRGEDTELDRSVIEEIGDPLIHLLRNAVDHGLEPPAERAAAGKPERGTLLLTARHEESRIIITVEDDGPGIDAARLKASAIQKGLLTEGEAAALNADEAIELIFKSGLSTARVVSDISGRGVGMDIVRANIERLNGSVLVESHPGRGTRFQIVLPLTLAIIPAMLVEVGEDTFALPLTAVTEVLHIPASEIRSIQRRPAIQLRGRVLMLARLGEALGFRPAAPRGAPAAQREYVVAVRWGKVEMGLIVDRLVGEQELVVKSLGPLVGETPGVSGAAILGDGSVALIVDVPGLFKLARRTDD